MRIGKLFSIGGWLVASSFLLWAVSQARVGRTLVLDDFESPDSAKKWEGSVQIAQGRPSHGAHSAQVRLEPGRSQISVTKLPQDWRNYDRLLFDIYCDRESMSMATLRIYDSIDANSGGPSGDDYYEARGKILVQKGWNHFEVKLQPLRAASDERDLSLEHIRRLVISADRARLPWTFYLDNVRLVAGQGGSETAPGVQALDPGRAVEKGGVTKRQGGRAEDGRGPAGGSALRQETQKQSDPHR